MVLARASLTVLACFALASLALFDLRLAALPALALASLVALVLLACLALPRSCRAASRLLRLPFASVTLLRFASTSFASASCVFATPRRETYSLPSIGATCGGSRFR
jgi:hypothetical protein